MAVAEKTTWNSGIRGFDDQQVRVVREAVNELTADWLQKFTAVTANFGIKGPEALILS